MKKLLAFVALMVFTLPISATDGITIANVSIPQGGEAIATVNLESVTNKYGGFQFSLQLPAGISIMSIVKADRLTAIENYALELNLTSSETNTYQVLGYNTSHTEIAGNNGDIAYITLRAGDGPTSGNALTANITGVVVSTVTPTNIDAANSSFTITIGEPEDFITLNENSPIAPASTSSNMNVKVKRTINANEWSTICLPFPMTVAKLQAAFGNDYALADMTDYEVTKDGDIITKIQVSFTERTGALLKNHPYIIKISNTISEFFVENVQIDPSEPKTLKKVEDDMTGEEYEKWSFIGSYVKDTSIPTEGLFLSGNNFYYSTGSTKMKAFRAYFKFNDVLSSYTTASRIDMFITDASGETTKIEDADFLPSNNDKVFNLSGQQVKNPGKGIYVKDGKKVIIK